MLLNKEERDTVWSRVKKELHFFPNCANRNFQFHIPPFRIKSSHVVYGIEDTNDDETIGWKKLKSEPS